MFTRETLLKMERDRLRRDARRERIAERIRKMRQGRVHITNNQRRQS